MGQTIVEKVLARASGRTKTSPGDIVTARVDLAVANDLSGPLAIKQMLKVGPVRFFDPERICFVAGRHAPFNNSQIAQNVAELGRLCRDQGVELFFGHGEGMDHVVLPEEGLVRPGALICNGDSHAATIGAFGAIGIPMGSTDMAYIFAFGETWLKVPPTLLAHFSGKPEKGITTKDLTLALLGVIGVSGADYMSIEYEGDALDAFSVCERATLPNMAVEMGAKTAVIAPRADTLKWLEQRGVDVSGSVRADVGASYERRVHIDAVALAPQIAVPHSPDNVVAVDQVVGTALDQINIGTCTNGRIEDLHQAAELLNGRKSHPGIRFLVTPASRRTYDEAMRDGTLAILSEAGAIINPPGCGACAGWHMGALAEREVCLATHNRNFKGRMGHPDAQIYLASPYVAAASAITGRITDPREFLN